MRKVILFIASSVDGYIADTQGDVGWLDSVCVTDEGPDAYSEFIANVDNVVMGWKTYHQITTELSPGEWVYRGLKSYVITHRKPAPAEGVHFTDENPAELIDALRAAPGKDIWICGGADIVGQLVGRDMIDEYYISLIPVLLGNGIRLFGHNDNRINLKAVKGRIRNGLVETIYERL